MKVIVTPSKISGELSAVSSKSNSHRLLIASALSDTTTKIHCKTVSDDTLATADCLRALGSKSVTMQVFSQFRPKQTTSATLFIATKAEQR